MNQLTYINLQIDIQENNYIIKKMIDANVSKDQLGQTEHPDQNKDKAVEGSTILKIPLSIQERIKKSTRSQTSQSISKASQSRRKKKSIKALAASRFAQKKPKEQNKMYCTICQDEFFQTLIISIGNCLHRFCKTCLVNYTTYKINIFEEVYCPQENCKETLCTKGEVYAVLELQLQKKYQKIHHYQKINKNEKLRLCPNQNCQGVIQKNTLSNQSIQCQKCQSVFCPRCFLKKHQGACDKYQVLFYQAGLSFRQCQKCKRVVEKIAGCDHIKCLCQYQFCYSCGRQWNHNHMCNKTPNLFYNYPCLNYTTKILFIIGYGLFIYPLLILSIIIQSIFILLLSLFVGVLVQPFALIGQICQQSKFFGALAILLFPVVIVVGIFRVAYDLFTQSFSDICAYDKFCSICIMIKDLFEPLENMDKEIQCLQDISSKKIMIK